MILSKLQEDEQNVTQNVLTEDKSSILTFCPVVGLSCFYLHSGYGMSQIWPLCGYLNNKAGNVVRDNIMQHKSNTS